MEINKFLTPYKYAEPVLIGSGEKGTFDEQAVDCPFVFWHQEKYYMMYIGFDGIGYQTALACSEDLLHWDKVGTILKRNDLNKWDSINISGTWILRENDLNGKPTLKK